MSTAAEFVPRPAAEHKTERPLAGWPEGTVLALIRHHIAPPFPIGSASRWHRHAGSLAEKRIAEGIASIVHGATGEEPLSGRIAIAAAGHAAALPSAPLRDLIEAGFCAALAAIVAERHQVAERVTAIRQRRTRPVLAEVAEQRKGALGEVRQGERALSAFMRERQRARQEVAAGTLSPAAFAQVERWAERRALPRLQQDLAEARAEVPAYRLTKGQRRRLAEFGDRLRRLRAAASALRRARRDLGRAKGRPPSRNAA